MERDLEARRYHLLADLFLAMESASGVDELARLSATTGREILAAASASISRYDAEAGTVRTLVNVGQLGPGESATPTDERYAVTDFPNLLRVAELQEPWSVHVDDPDGDQAELALLHQLDKSASLGCPIVLGTRVWGELFATRAGGADPFTARDRAAARMIAQAVALCVGRLIGRDELRELVYVDALTGLGNRRMADETLQLLAEQDSPATVALWDVDGLKLVNDRDGHLAGDRLLREVALLLSEAAGRLPGSVATRLGGDEFCLVAPAHPGSVVAALLEDMVRRASGFAEGAGVSSGVAESPALASEADVKALLRRADAALYRAKGSGGSRQEHDLGAATGSTRTVEAALSR